MPIANGVVQSLTRNDAAHLPAPGGDYKLVALDGLQAIRTLHPIWDDALETFEARARGAPNGKAQALAAVLILDTPLLVSAAPRRLALPDSAIQSPEDLVVLEGNHRVLAIAVRAAWNMPLPRCVGVFVHLG